MLDYMDLDIDTNRLIQLGFTNNDINALVYIRNNGGKFTPSALQSYGCNPIEAKKLSYMYNICAGKIEIETKEQLIRHLKKMFGSNYKISIQDLEISKITSVPRLAVVSNIKEKPFDIWNSNRYKGKEALYKVVDVSGQRITIETSRKPAIEYKKAKSIPGVLEIKGNKVNGNVVVSIDKEHCTLCNRFVIVASLRNPEYHHGKCEILCFEGTRVYVYATSIGVKENVKHHIGTQRVYDYGIFPSDIKPKLLKVSRALYIRLHGVAKFLHSPTSEYKVLDIPKEMHEEDDVQL